MSKPVYNSLPDLILLPSSKWEDYELLDSGEGTKLERFGPYQLIRPEPEAVWERALPSKAWGAAHAVFRPSAEEMGGHWELLQTMPESWTMVYQGLRFQVQLGASRHVGVFPEQASHWDWVQAQIEAARRPLKVLNLFGYTGLATLAAAQAGAHVTHLDASRKVITWARLNQQLSGLEERPVRWIVDDVLKYVQREARRGSQYDGLILDPPKFGRGPKGEVWEFYRLIPELLRVCSQVMSAQARFVVLTAYAVKASAVTLHYAVAEMMRSQRGEVSAGEIVLSEKSAGRAISMAVFARWKWNPDRQRSTGHAEDNSA
ncbi:MAG TPA: class I SAM-dependent methyltransferase [Levilinea sp.]|nr:class I SAM-dependent methyltransferase [Levilinea sp.]